MVDTITQNARTQRLAIEIEPMSIWQALLYFGLPAVVIVASDVLPLAAVCAAADLPHHSLYRTTAAEHMARSNHSCTEWDRPDSDSGAGPGNRLTGSYGRPITPQY